MRNIRVSILLITFTLIALGLIMVYSSSAIYSSDVYGDSAYFLKRHLAFLVIGCILGLLMMAVDYKLLQKHSRAILLVSCAFLALVLIPGIGRQAGGARRWISFLGFTFQPSEFAKLGIIVYLADFLSRKSAYLKDLLRGFLPATLVTGVAVGMILLQPDLGTAIAIGCVSFAMFFVAGIKVRHMLLAALSAVPFLYFLVFNVSYRRNRILAFIDPWRDPQGVGFQIIQSYIALGSGGLFGVGLGKSTQKLFYLPASHTDFIFSIIGEELGLLGAAAVVFLFILLVLQCGKVSLRAVDDFGKLLCLGIVAMIGLEAVINIAVSTGCIPTKGLPLPFVSYGGSSLVVHMVGMGLLLNVGRSCEEKLR